MAIQTLNTIKQWFKTSLKPSQQQFWDTWDSFRHKFEKVPVKDIEGIDELLLNKADKTVLDNHLADKNAHAPQVNTDWNSESGFSQLINKPEFKTINGEEIVGEGDITVSGGDSQDLQSILDVNNRATQGNSADGELTISMSGSEFEAINQRNSFSRSSSIIRNNAYYLQLSNYLQPSSGSANNISAQFRVEAGEASIEQSINGFNGQNTVVKFQRPERKDVTLLFPAKRANGEYIIATLDDITGGSQNLQQVLDTGNTLSETSSIEFLNNKITNYDININNPNLNSTNNISSNGVVITTNSGGEDLRALYTGEMLQYYNNTINSAILFFPTYQQDTSVQYTNHLTGGAYTIPVSVNGVVADPITGDITIPTGSSQDLRQTLENGNEAKLPILLKDKTYEANLYPGSLTLRDGASQAGINKSGLNFSGESGNSFLKIDNALVTNTSFIIPTSKPDGEYVLATLDDITGGGSQNLQQTLENGAIGTLAGRIKLSSERGDGEASLSLNVSEQLGGGSLLQDIMLKGTDGIRNSHISIIDGRMNIYTGNELGGSTSLDLTALEYVNSTNFSFPDVGGSRVIATTDDFKTINGESIIGEGDIEIGGGSQNLQKVLDGGNAAQQGTSSNLVARYELTELGLNTFSTKRVDTERSVSSIQNLAENLYLSNYYSPTDNITDAITSKIDFNLGNLEISQNINGGSGQNTKVRFETPLNTDVNLLFPTKNQNGTYKLATTDDILPKISRISDDFTIPDGYATRFITVLAINKTITLPNVTDSVGAIFYITGNPLGNTIINCKNRNLQILYQGNLESDYEIQANNGVTLINDGTNYIVTSRYP